MAECGYLVESEAVAIHVLKGIEPQKHAHSLQLAAGIFKNKHQAVSQGVRRFGKRSLSSDR
jgi:hypothetical protein